MRVRLHQLNPTVGDIRAATDAILQAMKNAEQAGVELLVLPEMTVCGYPAMDLLEREAFREAVYSANRRIVEASGATGVIFGTIKPNVSAYGRKCYNTALLAHRGKELAQVNKTLLPTYDVFDDLRYFEPNETFECIEFKGARLGITICEDIWYNENDIQYHTYEVNPARKLAEMGADAIINISASPFTKTKPRSRQEMLRNHVRELQIPIFYCNQVGANTELVFDGDSIAMDRQSAVVGRAPLFEEAFIDLEWEPSSGSLENKGKKPAEIPSKEAGIFRGLTLGLKDYLRKTGISEKVVLGLSGGIDSSLIACLAAESLGAQNVVAVTMPSEFSSEGSVSDSERLAGNLGITLHRLTISEIYDRFNESLEPLFQDTSFGVAEENLQSRIRGVLLMAISNKVGYMLLNTGNKSELATGFCTLYGDMNGGLGIISDLYKSEVYELARWLNESYYEETVIPESVLEKAPSAELRPGQEDRDTLPEYDVLDPILYNYIELQRSAADIAAEGFDIDLVKKVIWRVDRYEYKRFQAVPGLKMSTKAFGTGRRWPIVQRWSDNR
ncbi:MAG: NAD+ synthase [Balneolaceae bacterium]|nr:NAD+ synthase [Balneolaceae bacterium]